MNKAQGELVAGKLDEHGSEAWRRVIDAIGPELALLTVVSLWASTFIVMAVAALNLHARRSSSQEC